MRKAVFLDRDGTINVEKHYLYKIEDFEFLPGVIEGLKLLQRADYLLVIITNQSGIARGYYTEDDFQRLNSWMLKELKDKGVDIAKVYYCPHLSDAQVEKYRKECDCRKPNLGMYEQAVRELEIDLNISWTIGDKIRDCAICVSSACRGILIADNEKSEVVNAVKCGEIERVVYADSLLPAAKMIVEE